jgi:hypothetical protein
VTHLTQDINVSKENICNSHEDIHTILNNNVVSDSVEDFSGKSVHSNNPNSEKNTTV